MRRSTFRFMAVLLCLLAGSLYAQTTGKIAGRVFDKESGEALPGANVVIQGTTLGAASDVNGNYYIINIPPGSYILRATMIGYATVIQTDVRVSIDLTTSLDFASTQEVIQGEEITIVSTPPIIQKDISGSQSVVDVEAVAAGPYHDVNKVIASQVSILSVNPHEDRPQIRGNDISTALLVVDGVTQNDPISNRPRYYNVNMDAIQEISIQTGGFSARYGNFRSGVVNVVMKEGSQDYSFSANGRYSPPALKHFGPSPYGFDSPLSIPFVDPDAGAFTGNDFFPGWNQVAADESGPHQDKPMEVYARWLWFHRSRDSVNELKKLEDQGIVRFADGVNPDDDDILVTETGINPDYYGNVTFGGPIPGLNSFKPSTFFLSADRESMEYATAAPDDYLDQNYRGKLTSRLSPTTKLQLHGFWSRQRGFDGGEGPDISGFVSNSPYNRGGENKHWYPNCTWSGQHTNQIYGANWTQALSANTFYELKVSYHRTFKEMLPELRNTAPNPTANLERFPEGQFTSGGLGGVENGRIGTEEDADARAAAGEPGWDNWRDWAMIQIADQWYDETPEGWDPFQFRDIVNEYRFGSCGNRVVNTTTNSWRFNGAYTSQVTRHHLVEAGFEANQEDVDIYFRRVPGAGGTGFFQQAQGAQWKGAFYLTDKLEFQGFIANIGLRADWLRTAEFPQLDVNATDDKVAGPYSDFLLAGNTVAEGAPEGDFNTYDEIPLGRETKMRLSPRLGISHPISDLAKLFFNYGIMYQWENAYDTYHIEYDSRRSFQVSSYGNPAIDPPRTIQYELGYEHNLFDKMNLRITGYFQDITRQTNNIDYYPIGLGGRSYDYNNNNQFTDTRGIEVFLNMRRGVVPYFSGWASLNWLSSSNGRVGFDRFYEDPARQPRVINAQVSEPDVRPIVKVSTDFHTPEEFGPKLGDNFSLLGGASLNIIYNWRRGPQFTWNPAEIALVENNLRWKPYQRFDMRLTKSLFKVGKVRSYFYIDVKNVFNSKYMMRPDNNAAGLSDNIPNDVRVSRPRVAWDGHRWWNNQFLDYMNSLGYTPENQNEDGSFNSTIGTPGDDKGDLPAFTPYTFLEKRDVFFGFRFYF